jgi:hypothetical protein
VDNLMVNSVGRILQVCEGGYAVGMSVVNEINDLFSVPPHHHLIHFTLAAL